MERNVEYIRQLQERNRLKRQTNSKTKDDLARENLEKGFSTHFSGANRVRGHSSHQLMKSPNLLVGTSKTPSTVSDSSMGEKSVLRCEPCLVFMGNNHQNADVQAPVGESGKIRKRRGWAFTSRPNDYNQPPNSGIIPTKDNTPSSTNTRSILSGRSANVNFVDDCNDSSKVSLVASDEGEDEMAEEYEMEFDEYGSDDEEEGKVDMHQSQDIVFRDQRSPPVVGQSSVARPMERADLVDKESRVLNSQPEPMPDSDPMLEGIIDNLDTLQKRKLLEALQQEMSSRGVRQQDSKLRAPSKSAFKEFDSGAASIDSAVGNAVPPTGQHPCCQEPATSQRTMEIGISRQDSYDERPSNLIPFSIKIRIHSTWIRRAKFAALTAIRLRKQQPCTGRNDTDERSLNSTRRYVDILDSNFEASVVSHSTMQPLPAVAEAVRSLPSITTGHLNRIKASSASEPTFSLPVKLNKTFVDNSDPKWKAPMSVDVGGVDLVFNGRIETDSPVQLLLWNYNYDQHRNEYYETSREKCESLPVAGSSKDVDVFVAQRCIWSGVLSTESAEGPPIAAAAAEEYFLNPGEQRPHLIVTVVAHSDSSRGTEVVVSYDPAAAAAEELPFARGTNRNTEPMTNPMWLDDLKVCSPIRTSGAFRATNSAAAVDAVARYAQIDVSQFIGGGVSGLCTSDNADGDRDKTAVDETSNHSRPEKKPAKTYCRNRLLTEKVGSRPTSAATSLLSMPEQTELNAAAAVEIQSPPQPTANKQLPRRKRRQHGVMILDESFEGTEQQHQLQLQKSMDALQLAEKFNLGRLSAALSKDRIEVGKSKSSLFNEDALNFTSATATEDCFQNTIDFDSEFLSVKSKEEKYLSLPQQELHSRHKRQPRMLQRQQNSALSERIDMVNNTIKSTINGLGDAGIISSSSKRKPRHDSGKSSSLFTPQENDLSPGLISEQMESLPTGRSLSIRVHSTWGDEHYVGLNGIEFYDGAGHLITATDQCTIEASTTSVATVGEYCTQSQVAFIESIAAVPSGLNALRGYENDPRIVHNLINGQNFTRSDMHLWLAPHRSVVDDQEPAAVTGDGSEHEGGTENIATISLQFSSIIELSMVRIFNYNKSRTHNQRGVRLCSIILDNECIYEGEVAIASGVLCSVEEDSHLIDFTKDKRYRHLLLLHMAPLKQKRHVSNEIILQSERSTIEAVSQTGIEFDDLCDEELHNSLLASAVLTRPRTSAGNLPASNDVPCCFQGTASTSDAEYDGHASDIPSSHSCSPAMPTDSHFREQRHSPVISIAQSVENENPEYTEDVGALAAAPIVGIASEGGVLSPVMKGRLVEEHSEGTIVANVTALSDQFSSLRPTDVIPSDEWKLDLEPKPHVDNQYSYTVCRKIRLQLESTWGDPNFIGLCGIQLLVPSNYRNNSIPSIGSSVSEMVPVPLPLIIEELDGRVPAAVGSRLENLCRCTLDAFPHKDLSSVGFSMDDPRVLSNLLNECNDTCKDQFMWLVPFKRHSSERQVVELTLSSVQPVVGIRFWNYNKSHEDSLRGCKEISIYTDDELRCRCILRPAPGWDGMRFDQTILFEAAAAIVAVPDSTRGRYHIDSSRVASSYCLSPPVKQDYETQILPSALTWTFTFYDNWNDSYYIGLDAIELFDETGSLIDVQRSGAIIAAVPSSVRDLSVSMPPDAGSAVASDPRIPDRLLGLCGGGGTRSWLCPLARCMTQAERAICAQRLHSPEMNQRLLLSNTSTPSSCSYAFPKNNMLAVQFNFPVIISAMRLFNYSKNPQRGVRDFRVDGDGQCLYMGSLLRADQEKYNAHEGGSLGQSILFTGDARIVSKHKDYVTYCGSGNQDVLCINERQVMVRSKNMYDNTPPNTSLEGVKSNLELRPMTALRKQ